MSESNNLELILEKLRCINDKLDRFQPQEKSNNNIDNSLFDSLDVMTLLSLPYQLRTTATALIKLGHATASDVAKITHKRRAVESGYLNLLNRMGYVEKCREGRNIYFSINEEPDNHEHES